MQNVKILLDGLATDIELFIDYPLIKRLWNFIDNDS